MSAKLVIELDGGQHTEPEHEVKDAIRTRWLESQGYRVIRFWNDDILDRNSGAVEAILDVLGSPPT